MSYFGWKKVEMVIVMRYTRAFEIKQLHRILAGSNNGKEVKICPNATR